MLLCCSWVNICCGERYLHSDNELSITWACWQILLRFCEPFLQSRKSLVDDATFFFLLLLLRTKTEYGWIYTVALLFLLWFKDLCSSSFIFVFKSATRRWVQRKRNLLLPIFITWNPSLCNRPLGSLRPNDHTKVVYGLRTRICEKYNRVWHADTINLMSHYKNMQFKPLKKINK